MLDSVHFRQLTISRDQILIDFGFTRPQSITFVFTSVPHSIIRTFNNFVLDIYCIQSSTDVKVLVDGASACAVRFIVRQRRGELLEIRIDKWIMWRPSMVSVMYRGPISVSTRKEKFPMNAIKEEDCRSLFLMPRQFSNGNCLNVYVTSENVHATCRKLSSVKPFLRIISNGKGGYLEIYCRNILILVNMATWARKSLNNRVVNSNIFSGFLIEFRTK